MLSIDVGGLVDESSATLCVYGDDLEPAEVSALLGVEPSRSFRRGQRRTPDSRPAGHAAWLLRVAGTAPFGPNEHLRELLRRLPATPVVWSELRARYQVRISIGIHFDAWNRGFALDAATLAQVALTGVPLDFDLYAYVDDEAPRGESAAGVS